jgi:hypothetical protein
MKFIEFFLFLTVLAIWSLRIFIEWGNDFGIYYSGSFFISDLFSNEKYRIYEEFFDNKGPVYYLFLKFIGRVIGYGYYQAYISFYLSILVFYIPIYFIIKKNTKTFYSSLFFLTLALLLLVDQHTNSSIALFQSGLLIISFYYLLTAKNNLFFFYNSYLFFVLAVFTRIDSILFIFPFLYYFYFKIKTNCHQIKFLIFYIVIIPCIFLFLLIKFFDTSFLEFYRHNFSFNFWYNDAIRGNTLNDFIVHIIKKNHLKLLTLSFLLPVAIFLLASILENIKFSHNRKKISFLKTFLNKDFKKIILFLIFFSSILLWLKVYDKDYHLLVLSVPLLFVIINLSQFFLKHKYLQIIFMPFLLWSLSTEFVFLNKIKYNNFECLQNLFCKYSDAASYKKTIDSIMISNLSEIHIVGGDGWIYFFSQKKPTQSIMDWILYFKGNYNYKTEPLMISHKKLIQNKSGYLFWIHNDLQHLGQDSDLFLEIINSSEFIEDQGRYSMYKIK